MNKAPLFRIEAAGASLDLDLGIGHIARLVLERDGRRAAPYHRVPWAEEDDPLAGTGEAPHLARLSGDFFCAPFAGSDVEPAPAHGWPANAPWSVETVCSLPGGGVAARFRLSHPVMGAAVIKEFALRDDHPFLYQRHIFEGGSGAVTAANHAMVSLPTGARLTVSPKRWAETPSRPLEPDPSRGRYALAYPALSEDLTRMPLSGGGHTDLTRYPIAEGHEDFVALLEAEGNGFGWTAVWREGEGDLALMLKDARALPLTMLWFSNGGRFYQPWNGRHRNVLGVEDGICYSLYGHAASIAENALTRLGVPTALHLHRDGSIEVRHVIGAVPVPAGFGPVRTLRSEGDLLVVEGAETSLTLPFDAGFLGL